MLQLPNDKQRITVIGKTGSGKTQAALWWLAKRSYTTRPWIVFDFKREEMIAEITNLREIRITDKLPRAAGLYVVHPNPGDDHDVDEMLWQIWKQERTGVFIDEALMINKRSHAMQSILTQGRSKQIPVIQLTQRPVEVSRFALSEADYIQLFQITDRRDLKTVAEFMPLPIEEPLPGPYYSWWWDNSRDYKAILQPVPDKDTILGTFYERLKQPRRVI